MTTLLLKLVLTPAVMVAATLAGRRWGGAVSGWLVGLPLTSGPLVFVLTLEHGRRFAGRTAVGSLSGAIAEAAFCVGYALAPRAPLIAASLGFAFAVPRRSANELAGEMAMLPEGSPGEPERAAA